MRNRRDRDRAICPRCGREVTVRRDGGLMAHQAPADGAMCVPPAWKQRHVSTDQETDEESAALVDRNLRAMGSEGLQSTEQEGK